MRRNGEQVWVAWTNKGIIGKDGRIAEILCIGNDVTDRRKAKEALRESEEKLAGIISSVTDHMSMID
ncbi:MAG: hypothetical protein IMF10_08735 [Proteobacteria bacterium]|nr:hypothetical protein [Pseudomonadota bacterium]